MDITRRKFVTGGTAAAVGALGAVAGRAGAGEQARAQSASAANPGHRVAKKQVRGFGGMVGVQMKDRPDFFGHMKLCRNWTSLGDVQTLVVPYGSNRRWGIPENYVRMSIGVEDPDDIIGDLKQAMEIS